MEDKLPTTRIAFILLLARHAETIFYRVLRTAVSTLHSLTSSRASVENYYIIRIAGLPHLQTPLRAHMTDPRDWDVPARTYS